MKITYSILALAVAACLGQSARADNYDNSGPLNFAVVQDPHGGSHFLYYQSNPVGDSTSVALNTSGGGVENIAFMSREGVLPDNGEVKFVTGTNQHGEAASAYIPVSSNFAQGQQ
jgi:hypothetical protein